MMKGGLRPLKPPLAVIINPSSGGGKSLKIKLPDHSVRHVSVSEDDFRSKVCQFAKKYKAIGICGGDSSLTIAAEELQARKFRGELCFLPAGSVNDFVLEITEQQKRPSSIYLGALAVAGMEKKFIGQANWGLGVVVNRWVGKTLHAFPVLRPLQNLIGFLSIVLAHLMRREIVEATIETDGRKISGCYSIILVSQIVHWAGGLKFCPKASYLRPEFEVILVKRCGLIKLIRIILAAKEARHVGYPEVTSMLAKTVAIRPQKPQSVQIDGDILLASNAELKSHEFSLRKLKSAITLRLL